MTTITVPRALLEQALDALTSRDGDGWTRRFARDRAIEALEATLAQQAHTDDLNQRIKLYVGSRCAPPQQAEPVWEFKPTPLTDEEIPALAEKAWKPSVYHDAEALLGTDGLVALVRAVEAKHNIKE